MLRRWRVGYAALMFRNLVLSATAMTFVVSCVAVEPDGEPREDAVDAGFSVSARNPPFLELLTDTEDLALLGDAFDVVNYLGPVEGVAPRAPVSGRCLFQNMTHHADHLSFLQSLEGGERLTEVDFEFLVERRSERVWWGGKVRYLPGLVHPLTREDGVFVWTILSSDRAGNFHVDDIRAAHALLARCAPSFVPSFGFAPQSDDQRSIAVASASELANDGIAIYCGVSDPNCRR